MRALRVAGTRVLEPLHRFSLELPADVLGPALALLGRLGALPGPPAARGDACLLAGEIPAARVHDLRLALPSLTRGEGVLESEFARYEVVRGPVPERARTGPDPLDREAYLRVVRR
jgi:ribosomal protection tetracycline resistance protein